MDVTVTTAYSRQMTVDPTTVAAAAFGVCAVATGGSLVFLRGATKRGRRELARDNAEQARILGAAAGSKLHPARALAHPPGTNRS
jgi:hypothetical protein